MGVIEHDQQSTAGRGKSNEFGGRNEQPLVTRLAASADVSAGQGALNLDAVRIVQPVQ